VPDLSEEEEHMKTAIPLIMMPCWLKAPLLQNAAIAIEHKTMKSGLSV
jgi:hypothetical protein